MDQPSTSEELSFPIESVGKEAWRRMPLWQKAVGALLVLIGWLWSVRNLVLSSTLDVEIIIGPFVMGVAVFIAIFAVHRIKVQREFMAQFAAGNGYAFKADASEEDLQTMIGSPARMGTDRNMHNIVEGSYLGHPLRIFEYSLSIPSGKSSHIISYFVFELSFLTNFPNIFLVRRYDLTHVDVRTSKENLKFATHPKKVLLGGGFDDLFKLYAPEDYEAEALQVFDHGTLGYLAKGMVPLGNFSLELVENHLYLYMRGSVSEIKRLRGLYQISKVLVERLGPLLQKMKPALDAQEEVFTRLNRF